MAKKSNRKSEKPKTPDKTPHPQGRRFRSQFWFDNPNDPGMTALYFERYLNFGLTEKEIIGDRPITGIAQTGSDLSPCNRHHLQLAQRVREGIRDAGGIALEFSCHPIQETGKRPTAALDRNLSYLSLIEVLFGYPIDGVVLTTGCDKTTPAAIMAAATVNIPAIVLSGGPMLNGWWKGERAGSGTIKWELSKRLAAGEISYPEYVNAVAASAPSIGDTSGNRWCYCSRPRAKLMTIKAIAPCRGIMQHCDHRRTICSSGRRQFEQWVHDFYRQCQPDIGGKDRARVGRSA
jgi:dihydroxy-acid dehydratase